MDAETLYVALLSNPQHLQGVRRLQYRCAQRRCLLLDAIETPTESGILLHQNRYKYSPAENEQRSSEAGRLANTLDGENHWRARTYFIGQSTLAYPDDPAPMSLGITCDHVLEYMLTASEFRTDFAATRDEVRIRPDGTRFAV